MSQWVHHEKDLNMSKCFRCFTDNWHSWAERLKARGVVRALLLSLVGERFEPEQMQRKLLRSPFSFQNCTLIAKYEAVEKNVISNYKFSLQQSLVRSFTGRSQFVGDSS